MGASKYRELYDAVAAMQADDPPLKWAPPAGEGTRNMAICLATHSRRHGMTIKTFVHDGKLYVVKLNKLK